MMQNNLLEFPTFLSPIRFEYFGFEKRRKVQVESIKESMLPLVMIIHSEFESILNEESSTRMLKSKENTTNKYMIYVDYFIISLISDKLPRREHTNSSVDCKQIPCLNPARIPLDVLDGIG